MGGVVEFRCVRALAEQRDNKAVAEQLIDGLGPEAGYRIGYLARYAGLPHAESARLLAIADEIESRQGFGWWFPDEEPDNATAR